MGREFNKRKLGMNTGRNNVTLSSGNTRQPHAPCDGRSHFAKAVRPPLEKIIAANKVQYASVTGIHDQTPQIAPVSRAAKCPAPMTSNGDSRSRHRLLSIERC